MVATPIKTVFNVIQKQNVLLPAVASTPDWILFLMDYTLEKRKRLISSKAATELSFAAKQPEKYPLAAYTIAAYAHHVIS